MAPSSEVSESLHHLVGVLLVVLGLILMIAGIAAVSYQTCTGPGNTACSNPDQAGGIAALAIGLMLLVYGAYLLIRREPVRSETAPAPEPETTERGRGRPRTSREAPASDRDVPSAPNGEGRSTEALEVAADRFCPSCGGGNESSQELCVRCGEPLPPPP